MPQSIVATLGKIHDALAEGQRFGVFLNWVNPTPDNPGSLINSLPIQAYRFEDLKVRFKTDYKLEIRISSIILIDSGRFDMCAPSIPTVFSHYPVQAG